MSFLHPGYLFLLLLLPVGIWLEWLRRRLSRRIVPTILIWEKVLRSKGPPPRERFLDLPMAGLVIALVSASLAAAGPGIVTPGEPVRSLEIFLDRSAVSTIPDGSGRMRFDAGRKLAGELIGRLSQADRFILRLVPGGRHADDPESAMRLLEASSPSARPVIHPWELASSGGERTGSIWISSFPSSPVPDRWQQVHVGEEAGGNVGIVSCRLGEPDRKGRRDLLARIVFSGIDTPVTCSVEVDGEVRFREEFRRGSAPDVAVLVERLHLGDATNLTIGISPGGSLELDDRVHLLRRSRPIVGLLGDPGEPIVKVLRDGLGYTVATLTDAAEATGVDLLVVSDQEVPDLPRSGLPNGILLVRPRGTIPFRRLGKIGDRHTAIPSSVDWFAIGDVPAVPVKVSPDAVPVEVSRGVEGLYLNRIGAVIARRHASRRRWIYVGFDPVSGRTSWPTDPSGSFPAFWHLAAGWLLGGTGRSVWGTAATGELASGAPAAAVDSSDGRLGSVGLFAGSGGEPFSVALVDPETTIAAGRSIGDRTDPDLDTLLGQGRLEKREPKGISGLLVWFSVGGFLLWLLAGLRMPV